MNSSDHHEQLVIVYVSAIIGAVAAMIFHGWPWSAILLTVLAYQFGFHARRMRDAARREKGTP